MTNEETKFMHRIATASTTIVFGLTSVVISLLGLVAFYFSEPGSLVFYMLIIAHISNVLAVVLNLLSYFVYDAIYDYTMGGCSPELWKTLSDAFLWLSVAFMGITIGTLVATVIVAVVGI
jgi:hypothetical protein